MNREDCFNVDSDAVVFGQTISRTVYKETSTVKKICFDEAYAIKIKEKSPEVYVEPTRTSPIELFSENS